MELSRAHYLQVLPPHVDGGKGELHLFPARVLVSFVRNLNEDEEDPGDDAASHQHEHTCGGQVSHVIGQGLAALWGLKIGIGNSDVPKPCILSCGQTSGGRKDSEQAAVNAEKGAEFTLNKTASINRGST